MPIAESILPEFDHETAVTRLMLEKVPDEKAAWKPHERSRSLGELANHLALLPQWTPITLVHTEFDVNPVNGDRVVTPPFESTSQMLATYDEAVKAARALVASTTDGEFMVYWTLKSAGKTVFTMPRVGVFRSFVLNHAVHHRGQLSVYLRLCDISLPNIYGPTADTLP